MRAFTGPAQALSDGGSLEWLETNGLGDCAMSTAAGLNTRRYHGLYTASLLHLDRHVLLSCLEDWLCTDEGSWPLSVREHPGCVHPRGADHLRSFSAKPCPAFRYEAGGYEITRSLVLPRSRRALLVRWSLKALPGTDPGKTVTLRVSPLLAFRFFHSLTHANMDLQVRTWPARRGFKIRPYNALPPLCLQVQGDFVFLPSPEWVYAVRYPVEEARGFDAQEDLFSPGLLEIHLRPGEDCWLSASIEELRTKGQEGPCLSALWDEEMARRESEDGRFAGLFPSPVLASLARQSEIFIRTSPGGGRRTLLAGWPWFGSWGRDTLIALPGTAFLAGRLTEGTGILRSLARAVSGGIVPNTLDCDGHARGYNSVDASLWLAWTCQQLIAALGPDGPLARMAKQRVAPYIYDIIRAFRDGHVPFAFVTPQGLLETGTPSTQLTWMDAQVDGRPVTPRHGFAVEIQALWYNTLAFGRELAEFRGDPDPALGISLEALREAFARRFVLPDGTLCDVWRGLDEGGPDRSFRPNQILALSLPAPLAPESSWQPVVRAVGEKLLTPFGLRTLAPEDPAYRPVYAGGPAERDGAYHQGTVWPWLLGAYGDALFRASRLRPDGSLAEKVPSGVVADLLERVTPLVTTHRREACLGHIGEIFSGSAPYAPDGAGAQAWSEGEVFRLLLNCRREDPEAFAAWEAGVSADWD